MNIIVCEDDPFYLQSISEKITRWSRESGHMNITIRSFASSEEFLEVWARGMNPDLLFLDIQFKFEMDGMELAKQVRATDNHVHIVFITNSDAYIRDGYIVGALRYLSKPVCYEEIATCLDIAYNQFTLACNEFLILSSGGRRLAFRYDEILYLEALSPYTLIAKQGEDSSIQLRCPFSSIAQKLPQELFVPCHRSYIVNLMHVRCLKRTELFLSDGKRLPVSRPYVNTLNTAFDSYYQEGCRYGHVEPI